MLEKKLSSEILHFGTMHDRRTVFLPDSGTRGAFRHGWSFSEIVGGAKWLINWMFCYKTRNWMSKCLQVWQICMTKVKNHCFRARKSPNVPKVGVAKHKVGVANLKVVGQPPHQLYRKLRPCISPIKLQIKTLTNYLRFLTIVTEIIHANIHLPHGTSVLRPCATMPVTCCLGLAQAWDRLATYRAIAELPAYSVALASISLLTRPRWCSLLPEWRGWDPVRLHRLSTEKTSQ